MADHTDHVNGSIYGSLAPVWMEPAEPTLEDVYWMFWELVGGKQYLAFRRGSGFGRASRGQVAMQTLTRNPFQSPSNEALFHSANWKAE
jgi:hypothetical protein